MFFLFSTEKRLIKFILNCPMEIRKKIIIIIVIIVVIIIIIIII